MVGVVVVVGVSQEVDLIGVVVDEVQVDVVEVLHEVETGGSGTGVVQLDVGASTRMTVAEGVGVEVVQLDSLGVSQMPGFLLQPLKPLLAQT